MTSLVLRAADRPRKVRHPSGRRGPRHLAVARQQGRPRVARATSSRTRAPSRPPSGNEGGRPAAKLPPSRKLPVGRAAARLPPANPPSSAEKRRCWPSSSVRKRRCLPSSRLPPLQRRWRRKMRELTHSKTSTSPRTSFNSTWMISVNQRMTKKRAPKTTTKPTSTSTFSSISSSRTKTMPSAMRGTITMNKQTPS